MSLTYMKFREGDEKFISTKRYIVLCQSHRRRETKAHDRSDMDLTSGEHRTAVGEFLTEAQLGFLYVNGSNEIVDSDGMVSELFDIDDDRTGTDLRGIDPDFGPELTDAVNTAVRDSRIVEKKATMDDGMTLQFRAVPGRGGVGVIVRDATEHFGVRRDLRRSNRILETLEDGVYTLNEAFVITSVNETVTEMTGYDRDELVGSHASMLAGSETVEKAEELLAMLRGDGSDIGMIESSIVTADGESVPIETRFSSVEFDDGRHGHVGILRNVTNRQRSENALRELNRSARRLLRADDTESIFETIVEVITSVWPEATSVAYSFDRDESRLVPAATSGGEHGECGPGSLVWKAFTTGEGESKVAIDPTREVDTDDDTLQASFQTVDCSEHAGPSDGESAVAPTGRVIERSNEPTDCSDQTLYATLDRYGLFRIEFDSEELAENAEEPVELLAANAVAALDRVGRENELSRNRDRLERLHGLNELLRRMNGDLAEARTLEDIAKAVCETLIEADQVDFVWVGETYRTGGDPAPVAWEGESNGDLKEWFRRRDGRSGDIGDNGGERPTDWADHPSIQAIETECPVRVPDVSDGLRSEQWREHALSRGYRSIMSVPLSYDDLYYGVLSVYADTRAVFDGEFGDLLVEVGDNVANAINGLETRRSLRSGSLVELTLRIDDTDALLSRVASGFGETLHVEATAPQGNGRSLIYFTTDGEHSDLADSVEAIESVQEMSRGSNGRTEASVSGNIVADRLSALGGVIRQIVADSEGLEVTVTFPRPADVRLIVEHLMGQYDHVELLSRRDRTESDRPVAPTELSGELTDRQREAVETAYLGGYFDWPRSSTGEEVATMMDITQPTFNRHLRTAERKLLGNIFADGDTND